MSIHYDKERKTYYVRWRETNKVTGEIKHRKKCGFETKKEAKSFESEVIDNTSYVSFLQLSELYIDSLKGYANDDTRKRKTMMVNKYMKELHPMNVKYIKKSDLLYWRNGIADLNRSLSIKNRILEICKAISKFGADYYDYPDFAKGIKAFPASSDDIRETKILSHDDLNKALEYCDNEVYKRYYTFLYHTGCRRGEALALLKSDVHGKEVSISKSIRNYKNGFTPLKNRYSKRTILLTDKAYNAIKPLLKTEGDFIFGGLEPLPVTNLARVFDKALEKAELSHYRLHDLRHSFISNAILNGIDIVSVSRYVGHANIEMTLNRYSHLLKDSEKRMINKLNELNK